MYYLVKPIIYKFENSCNLALSRYNMKISDIAKYDQQQLNQILNKVKSNLYAIEDQAFINSKRCQYVNNKGEDIWPTDLPTKRWMIEVEIQGYKINSKEEYSPIWRLTKVVDIYTKPNDSRIFDVDDNTVSYRYLIE